MCVVVSQKKISNSGQRRFSESFGLMHLPGHPCGRMCVEAWGGHVEHLLQMQPKQLYVSTFCLFIVF